MRRIYAPLNYFKSNLPLLMALVGSCMLGLSPIFVRLADVGSNAIGCYRMVFALPLVWLWMQMENRTNPPEQQSISKTEFLVLAAAGVFFALDIATWHLSIQMTSIINSAIFNNLTPIFVPILIWVLYKARPSPIYLVSATAAILGSIVMSGSTLSLDADNLAGDLLAIFSAVAYTGYIVLVKSLRHKLNAPTIIFYASFTNILLLGIFAVLSGEVLWPSSWQGWAGIIGLAVLVQIFGQGLLAYSMGKLSAAFVSVTMLLGPVVSAFLGWIIFGEAIGIFQTLGCTIVLSSIVTASIDERRSQKQPSIVRVKTGEKS